MQRMSSSGAGRGNANPGTNANDIPIPRPTAATLAARRAQLFRINNLPAIHMNIETLLESYADGILFHDLMPAYRRRFGHELHMERLGYNSILELVGTLPRSMGSTWITEDRNWLLMPTGKVPSREALSARDVSPLRAPPPSDPDDALPNIPYDEGVFPEDCMQLGERIPPPRAALELAPGDIVLVRVFQVYSPWRFYMVRSDHSASARAFEDLKKQMTQYYASREGRERKLAPGAAQPGHGCCLKQDGHWLRAQVCRCFGRDSVQVRLVDVGGLVTTRFQQLRPLLREFGSLPAQAARAQLAYVAPRGPKWPSHVSASFRGLVMRRLLNAEVVAVDNVVDVIDVTLHDTAADMPDDTVLNELLLSGGASPFDSTRESREGYYNPSFESLESGAHKYGQAPPSPAPPSPPSPPPTLRLADVVVGPGPTPRPGAPDLEPVHRQAHRLLAEVDEHAAHCFALMHDRRQHRDAE